MKIIPYGRQSIDKADIAEVVKILRSDFITCGPKIEEFEDALCKYTQAKYAVVVSSGTAALHIACIAAGIERNNEVITSSITFVATVNAILYAGGKPVLADIQEDTVNIDPPEAKKKITKKTKAIIPVHFAGHPAEMDKIHNMAKKHNLIVIEDACHALGAEYKISGNSSKVGSGRYSDMAIFSFHPVKAITTGEGGAVVTNNKKFYEKLILLRNHGITRNALNFKFQAQNFAGPWYYEMQELGFNYRITDFQCALGISQLKKLDNFIEKRRKIVNIYNQELSGIDGVILPIETAYAKSAWHIYCIRLKNSDRRKEVFEKMQKLGIGLQVHYVPIHLQPYYREKFGYQNGDYPKAEEYYKRAITLPIHPRMVAGDVKQVINCLRKSL